MKSGNLGPFVTGLFYLLGIFKLPHISEHQSIINSVVCVYMCLCVWVCVGARTRTRMYEFDKVYAIMGLWKSEDTMGYWLSVLAFHLL